jgi:hypothetical protein
MPTEINKPKVLNELLKLRLKLEQELGSFEGTRFSPATKEVYRMMIESVKSCAEAVRNGHPLMFEINIWEQQSLTGWAIDMKELEE